MALHHESQQECSGTSFTIPEPADKPTPVMHTVKRRNVVDAVVLNRHGSVPAGGSGKGNDYFTFDAVPKSGSRKLEVDVALASDFGRVKG